MERERKREERNKILGTWEHAFINYCLPPKTPNNGGPLGAGALRRPFKPARKKKRGERGERERERRAEERGERGERRERRERRERERREREEKEERGKDRRESERRERGKERCQAVLHIHGWRNRIRVRGSYESYQVLFFISGRGGEGRGEGRVSSYLAIQLSSYLSICLSMYPSIHLSTYHLSIYLFI